MKKSPTGILVRRGGAIALLALLVLVPACGENDNPVDPADRVCGGKSDFGARVLGRAQPVDVCASNESASVLFTDGNNYSVRASMSSDGVFYEFQFLIPHRSDFPIVLTLHDDFGAAVADEFGVWMFYQEIPDGGEALESFEITGGTFTLSFSDGSVMTATFSGVKMNLRRQETPNDARGSRTIEKGFMSVSVDL